MGQMAGSNGYSAESSFLLIHLNFLFWNVDLLSFTVLFVSHIRFAEVS